MSTVRSVFICSNQYPYFKEVPVEFEWFGGFANSQKRKCQLSLHQNFNTVYSDKVLEISGSSLDSLGAKLSAMNLKKETRRGITSVESAFQSSRIYYPNDVKVGTFPDFLFLEGKECKKRVKELSQGDHSYLYEYQSVLFPTPAFHISLFYDWLYLNALSEEVNKEVADALINSGYTAFSDLATKALNSQARSCAIFVSLYKLGLLSEIKDFNSYMSLFRVNVGKEYKEVLEQYKKPIKNMDNWLLSKRYQMKDSWENVKPCPLVPCTVGREEIEAYYVRYYSHLTNKKNDVYKRIGVYDINFHTVSRVCSLKLKDKIVGYRFYCNNGAIDVKDEIFDIIEPISTIELVSDGMGNFVTQEELQTKVLYPCATRVHADVIIRLTHFLVNKNLL